MSCSIASADIWVYSVTVLGAGLLQTFETREDSDVLSMTFNSMFEPRDHITPVLLVHSTIIMMTYGYHIEFSHSDHQVRGIKRFSHVQWILVLQWVAAYCTVFVWKVESAGLSQDTFRRLLSSSKSSDNEWMARQSPDVSRGLDG